MPSSNRAFTLVELLVTMGLMAMLATVSIAGYYGAVKGMTERGAKDDVISFIRLAQQRALVEQTPVAVFFMNRALRAEDEDTGAAARTVGIAVAVRMCGRISYINGNYLSDEYADLEKTYPTRSTQSGYKGSTMRLWRMVEGSSVENCFSTVRDCVEKKSLQTETLLMCGNNYTTNTAVWCFVKEGGDGNAQWRTGDPYGTEIASLQLPHGYVFEGGSMPSTVGETKGAGNPFFFFPDENSIKGRKDATGQDFNFSGIKISAVGTGSSGTQRAANINRNDLKDTH